MDEDRQTGTKGSASSGQKERVFNTGRLSTLLNSGKGIVLDGALATHLETLGADISSSLWSASLLQTNPTLIHRTHTAYFHAGAHIATTASYQASLQGLTTHLAISPAEATALVRKSVELAQQARDEYLLSSKDEDGDREKDGPRGKDLLIAASIGPYGATLATGAEYTGAYTLSPTAFHTFHRPRIAALLTAGADTLAIETLPSFPETRALLSLLTTEFPHAESWFAFTLSAQDPTRIADGTPLAAVVPLLDACRNVVALGVNCMAPGLALAGLREMARLTAKPLVVYANSGETWDAGRRGWDGEKSGGGELAAWTRACWEVGARIVGGCCRTGPEDIRVIAEVLGEIGRDGDA